MGLQHLPLYAHLLRAGREPPTPLFLVGGLCNCLANQTSTTHCLLACWQICLAPWAVLDLCVDLSLRVVLLIWHLCIGRHRLKAMSHRGLVVSHARVCAWQLVFGDVHDIVGVTTASVYVGVCDLCTMLCIPAALAHAI